MKKLLKASVCEKLPECKTGWKEMCSDIKSSCETKQMGEEVKCEIEGSACVKVGTEELCMGVSEQSTLLNLCKEAFDNLCDEKELLNHVLCEKKGIAEMCKETHKRKVCTKEEPKTCVEVEELSRRVCTRKDGGSKKWCETEKSKKMGTKEVCTVSQKPRWQECKVDEYSRRKCRKEKCDSKSRTEKLEPER